LRRLNGKKERAAHRTALVHHLRKVLMFGFYASAVGHFTLVYAQAETTFGVGADPSLEQHGSAFLSIIRKRDQVPVVALLALRPVHQPASFSHDPVRVVSRGEPIRRPKLNQRAMKLSGRDLRICK
jgi:hypothetical protein